MKKLLFVFCLALVLPGIIKAQSVSTKKSYLGLSLGWQNFTFYDQHASPLTHGTNSIFPHVGLSFERETGRSFFGIKLDGAIGSANPLRFGARDYQIDFDATHSFQYQITSQFINAHVGIVYLRRIKSLQASKLQYWVGGAINETAFYADEVASFPWLLNTLTLDPTFKLQYVPHHRHRANVGVDFTLAGMFTRAPFSIFPKSNHDKNVPAYFKQGTRLATINGFQKVNLQVGYGFQLARHLAIGATYKLQWFHYNYPKKLIALDKHFDINIAYTF